MRPPARADRWRTRRAASAARTLLGAATSLLLASCGSGGGEGAGGANQAGCDGSCLQRALTAEDVETILVHAVGEAERLGVAATIAVLDRAGNVLALFAMDGAAESTVLTSARTPRVLTGLETVVVPADLAALSKAGTAAYLSSQGNAFSTRTASLIVQEHFFPGESGRPAGPLFGVQFSQLACSDLASRFDPLDPGDRTGPHRLPLGLSADPGGIPLFKASASADGAKSGRVPVGGIGVEIGCAALACDACTADPASVAGSVLPACANTEDCLADRDSLYTFDPDISDFDVSLEERIASAGAAGFEAPADRRAERIFVDGKALRFAEDEAFGPLASGTCEGLDGDFVVRTAPASLAYTDVSSCAEIPDGVALGDAESGILAVDDFAGSGLAAEVLVDASGDERYAPRDGTFLAKSEVASILRHALDVALRLRAQIRRPLDTPARVTISLVDVDGSVLGLVRTRDAPVFGIDVSLQKARGCLLASSPDARDVLEGLPGLSGAVVAPYVDATVEFLTTRATFHGDPIDEADVLTGAVAFADRPIGNLSRPFFPDGIDRRSNGPLSNPFEEWSPFSTGLQLALVLEHVVGGLCGGVSYDRCSPLADLRGGNGIQIFPGSVPVYRGRQLVGGLGISGDGIDQDDAVCFLGLQEAGLELGTVNNAPADMRSDNISIDGSHLRFVSCPVRPFIGSDEEGVCDGK